MSKPRGRPFAPGNKLGRGRPKGSGNRNEGSAKAILEEYALHLTRKLVAKGLEGNPQALRLCIERIMPAPRDACVPINLPKINSAQDFANAAEKVIRGMGKGALSPSQAEQITNVLQNLSRVFEIAETEKRVEKLEEHLANIKKGYQRD